MAEKDTTEKPEKDPFMQMSEDLAEEKDHQHG
jgi:hypothetical protein